MLVGKQLLWRIARIALLGLGAIATLKAPTVQIPSAQACSGCSAFGGHTYCIGNYGDLSSCEVINNICIFGPPCL